MGPGQGLGYLLEGLASLPKIFSHKNTPPNKILILLQSI